jgi:hypothetical protein
LSEVAQTLEVSMRTSVEMFETAMRSATAQQRPVDDESAISFPELRAAVEELTAVLRRLSAVPENIEEATPLAGYAGASARRKAPAPGLARELRGLLHEIDAAR